MGPMPKKVTPMPRGRQTICWYFQPVAKMTNSVTVAINSSGSVKYEMRLFFNHCNGAKPCKSWAAVGPVLDAAEAAVFGVGVAAPFGAGLGAAGAAVAGADEPAELLVLELFIVFSMAFCHLRTRKQLAGQSAVTGAN